MCCQAQEFAPKAASRFARHHCPSPSPSPDQATLGAREGTRSRLIRRFLGQQIGWLSGIAGLVCAEHPHAGRSFNGQTFSHMPQPMHRCGSTCGCLTIFVFAACGP